MHGCGGVPQVFTVLAEMVIPSISLSFSHQKNGTSEHILVSDDHIVVPQEFLDILNEYRRRFLRSNVIALSVPKAEKLCKGHRD